MVHRSRLTPQDFKLLEDGKGQNIHLATANAIGLSESKAFPISMPSDTRSGSICSGASRCGPIGLS
jgi:hypothetical protein